MAPALLLAISLCSVALCFNPSPREFLGAELMDIRKCLYIYIVYLDFMFAYKTQIFGLERFHQHEVYKI